MVSIIQIMLLGCFPFFLFGQQLEEAYDHAPKATNPEKPNIGNHHSNNSFLDIEYVLPYLILPKCGQMSTHEQKLCSDLFLKNFIDQHLKYPQTAFCGEGTVYVRFVVETNGKMSNIEVVKNMTPHKAFEAEALKVVQLLNKKHKWQPQIQNKKTVSCRMVIPVKFKLK